MFAQAALSGFVLMITNHMMLFGTNKVLVFISLQVSREKIVVHSSSKGRL